MNETINDLLLENGLDTQKKIKLIRHCDERNDLDKIYYAGKFNTYQSFQIKRPFGRFSNVYLVSFMGAPRCLKCLFIGIYKLSNPQEEPITQQQKDDFLSWYSESEIQKYYFYDIDLYNCPLNNDSGNFMIRWNEEQNGAPIRRMDILPNTLKTKEIIRIPHLSIHDFFRKFHDKKEASIAHTNENEDDTFMQKLKKDTDEEMAMLFDDFHINAQEIEKTEIYSRTKQRVGQSIFRERLLEYWKRRCSLSGVAFEKILRASHIKPWKECHSDKERLSVFNGLLLTPTLDALFDGFYMTFSNDGEVIFSKTVTESKKRDLGLQNIVRLHKNLTPEHHKYLEWHRDAFFEKESLR